MSSVATCVLRRPVPDLHLCGANPQQRRFLAFARQLSRLEPRPERGTLPERAPVAPRSPERAGIAPRSPERAAMVPRCAMRGAASRHSSSTAASDPGASGRRTITTRSNGEGQSERVARKASRTSRLARFRTTALPTRRDAVIPSRGFSDPGGQGAIRKMKPGATTRPPPFCTRMKSERFRSRSHALKRPFGRRVPGIAASTPATSSSRRSLTDASAHGGGGSAIRLARPSSPYEHGSHGFGGG